MHKYTMMTLCLMAALGAVLLEVNASPAGVAIPTKLDPSQLGGLSAQFLPPEYRNTNVSVGESNKSLIF